MKNGLGSQSEKFLDLMKIIVSSMCLEQISDEYSMKKGALPGLSQVVTYTLLMPMFNLFRRLSLSNSLHL
jgi:hypothetical protein